ncbi:hypothetical protein MB46_07320 [Arthrobacter alpinus]|uniref:hypothetical protein n=1 Tax=Arthrobacter alpinus TaxID=656366 RepID=UPI0005C841FB|nr:hypothetical protein [Arthrobacter alpinus]ALV45330.1 hypothetical protein MB46_07320 [Arthrobacter alpinus]
MRSCTLPTRPLPGRFRAGLPSSIVAGNVFSLPPSSTSDGCELAQSHDPTALLVGAVTRGLLDGSNLAFLGGLVVGPIAYHLRTRTRIRIRIRKTTIAESSEQSGSSHA